MHVPAVNRVAFDVEDEAVHTVGVVVVKLTGNVELAENQLAKFSGTDALITCEGICAYPIVCETKLTVELCVTVGAGA